MFVHAMTKGTGSASTVSGGKRSSLYHPSGAMLFIVGCRWSKRGCCPESRAVCS